MNSLVLVHGFMGGSDQWNHQAPLGNGRELICVDLPGFGKNARLEPLHRIEDFASWVLEELTRRGVWEFDLLGHSMGGMIVQEMIRKEPERVARLVLYGTGAKGVLPGRFESVATSMERARTDGAKATAHRISATWFLHTDAATSYPACAAIAERSTLQAILAGLEAMQAWTGENYLPEIKAETLILWGDRDRSYLWPQTENLWRTIPNSHLAVIPGCAHAVHMERHEMFNRLVDEFLSVE